MEGLDHSRTFRIFGQIEAYILVNYLDGREDEVQVTNFEWIASKPHLHSIYNPNSFKQTNAPLSFACHRKQLINILWESAYP